MEISLLPPAFNKDAYQYDRDIKVLSEGSATDGNGYTWCISNFKVSGQTILMYRPNGRDGLVIV